MTKHEFHAAALAAVREGKRIPPIKETEPQPGWYRVHDHKLGPKDDPANWVGVLIAWDGDADEDEEIAVFVAGKESKEPAKIWTACARYPISEDLYKEWKRAKTWPVQPQKPAKGGRGIGDNSKSLGIAPQALEIIREAEDALAGVKTIANETLAQKIAAIKNKLTAAVDIVEEERKGKTGPLNDQVKALNTLYKDPKERAEKLKNIAVNLLAAYMDDKGELTVSPGPGSRTVTLQKRYDAEIENIEECWQWAKDDPKVREAIEESAKRQIKAANGALRLAGVKNIARSTVV